MINDQQLERICKFLNKETFRVDHEDKYVEFSRNTNDGHLASCIDFEVLIIISEMIERFEK